MKLLFILGAVILAACSIWGCAPTGPRLIVATGYPGAYSTFHIEDPAQCQAMAASIKAGKFKAVCDVGN